MMKIRRIRILRTHVLSLWDSTLLWSFFFRRRWFWWLWPHSSLSWMNHEFEITFMYLIRLISRNVIHDVFVYSKSSTYHIKNIHNLFNKYFSLNIENSRELQLFVKNEKVKLKFQLYSSLNYHILINTLINKMIFINFEIWYSIELRINKIYRRSSIDFWNRKKYNLSWESRRII